jgi:hypothetical protein
MNESTNCGWRYLLTRYAARCRRPCMKESTDCGRWYFRLLRQSPCGFLCGNVGTNGYTKMPIRYMSSANINH